MTDALSWPRHPLTLEEWDALPEDETFRLELVEGMLVTSPQPYSWHQRAVRQLAVAVEAGLPKTLIALCEVEIVLAGTPPTVRVPDVMVTSTVVYEANPARYASTDVQLAVEVLSKGTRRVDRVMKFSEYADAGIPQYWIVDLDDPITLTSYLLVDGDYELVAEATDSVDLEVAGNPVHVDVSALTRR